MDKDKIEKEVDRIIEQVKTTAITFTPKLNQFCQENMAEDTLDIFVSFKTMNMMAQLNLNKIKEESPQVKDLFAQIEEIIEDSSVFKQQETTTKNG